LELGSFEASWRLGAEQQTCRKAGRQAGSLPFES
jgi:hypothetical protein